MAADEISHRPGEDLHKTDGDHDGDDHDHHIIHHAHGGDDGIEREDDVQDRDLDEDGPKHRLPFAGIMLCFFDSFDFVVEFLGAFPKKEEAAEDEDQVLA